MVVINDTVCSVECGIECVGAVLVTAVVLLTVEVGLEIEDVTLLVLPTGLVDTIPKVL